MPSGRGLLRVGTRTLRLVETAADSPSLYVPEEVRVRSAGGSHQTSNQSTEAILLLPSPSEQI